MAATTSVGSRVGAFFRNQAKKTAEFWRDLARDYTMVAKDTVTGCKEKPFRAATIFGVLGGLAYAGHTNPSHLEMMNELAERRQTMSLVPITCHSEAADGILSERSHLLNTSRLHYYDLWFFSLLVKTNHDDKVRIFHSQDKNLHDWPWTEFYNNIVDVGAFGRWFKLEEAFHDYDISQADMKELAEQPPL